MREHEVWWINKRNNNCNCKSVHAELNRFFLIQSPFIQIFNKCCALLWQSLRGKNHIPTILNTEWHAKPHMKWGWMRSKSVQHSVSTDDNSYIYGDANRCLVGMTEVRGSPPPALAQRRKSTSRDVRLTYTLLFFYLLLVFVFELL